jgi:hypothetical protein
MAGQLNISSLLEDGFGRSAVALVGRQDFDAAVVPE